MLEINLNFHSKFKNYESIKNKIAEAARRTCRLRSDVKFFTSIANFEFQGQRGFADSCDEYTTVLIANTGEFNFRVIPYKSKKNIIGYVYENELWINTEIYKQSDWLVSDCAANLMHEVAHKAGYTHTMHRTWQWQFTVPYALGSLVKKLINDEDERLTLSEIDSVGLNHMSKARNVFYKLINFIS